MPDHTSAPILRCEELTKTINGREILGRCTLAVAPGEICAIIGPNGAGKTTLFKTLTGMAFPTAGTVAILETPFDGANRDRLLSEIGAVIEVPRFPSRLTATDVLRRHLELFGLPTGRVDALLTRVGLQGAGETEVSSYSLGMRQRLALARAISHSPRLLVLDEPSNGLDPTGVADLRVLLSELAATGVAILVAGHTLTEIERTAHSVAVLDQGRLTVKQELSTVIDAYGGGLEEYYHANTGRSVV